MFLKINKLIPLREQLVGKNHKVNTLKATRVVQNHDEVNTGFFFLSETSGNPQRNSENRVIKTTQDKFLPIVIKRIHIGKLKLRRHQGERNSSQPDETTRKQGIGGGIREKKSCA